MKVFIRTFGCQMNKLDSDNIATTFLQQGYQLVDDEKTADIILFNTCSVRKSAEERAYANLRILKGLKDKNPSLIIGLIGCLAEKDKTNALNRVPYLDLICGPNQEYALPLIIEEIKKQRQTIVRTGPDRPSAIRHPAKDGTGEFIPPTAGPGVYPANGGAIRNHSSAFVLAMRGCDNFCSYCVVPYLRGREISRLVGEIVDEVKNLAEKGVKEITLLGQNITAYGKNIQENLSGLLRAVNEISGVKRIRFITSHPSFVTEELFRTIRDLPKICPHLHIPAQSGSDKILKAMNRRYTRADYLRIIENGRKIVPEIEFGSDFIVGFPGEENADFQETVTLLKEVRFLNSFIFKYSPRPGTRASKLKDDVPYPVKQERNKILLETQNRISLEKNRALVGKTVEVLVEGKSKNNLHKQSGRTRQNHIVILESPADLTGQLIQVKIMDATALSLRGKVV